MSVCLFVCLSACSHILKATCQISPKCLYVLPLAVARCFSDGSADYAVRYALPVSWTTKFSHNGANGPESKTAPMFRWVHQVVPLEATLLSTCIVLVIDTATSSDITISCVIITGPPTHDVGARLVTVAGVCRRRLSFVTFHGRPAGGFSRAGQAMTSRRLQSNYSSTAARRASCVTFR